MELLKWYNRFFYLSIHYIVIFFTLWCEKQTNLEFFKESILVQSKPNIDYEVLAISIYDNKSYKT